MSSYHHLPSGFDQSGLTRATPGIETLSSRPNIGIHILACIPDTGRVKLEKAAQNSTLVLRQQAA
jgi:hypothetical protein